MKAAAARAKVTKIDQVQPRTAAAETKYPVPAAAVFGKAFDFRNEVESWERRRVEGKALRGKTPHEAQAEWSPPKDRPDPVATVLESNAGRQEHLVPLRMGRMAASPFAFLRGSCVVMDWDLAHTPFSGISVIVDGDAHLNNFGFYGTPQRDVVMDLNDFDEVTQGPWEWDLKRLVASFNVAARENGMNRRERRAAVMQCVEGYRFNAARLQNMPHIDIWHLHAYPGRDNPLIKLDPKTQAVI